MPELLDRLKSALADRYAIQEEIGAGGMATVYLPLAPGDRGKQIPSMFLCSMLIRLEGGRTVFFRRMLAPAIGLVCAVGVSCTSALPGIHTAASAGNVERVREFLDDGVLVDKLSGSGQTPLDAAAASGHLEIVNVLLSRGADPDHQSFRGWSPLWVTCSSEVMAALIGAEADVGIEDVGGQTALHDAFRCDGDESTLVAMLLDGGADPDHSDAYGITPLHMAAGFASVEALRLLLQSVKEVNRVNLQGLTPRDVAALLDKQEALALFDEFGGQSSKYDEADPRDATFFKGGNFGGVGFNALPNSWDVRRGFVSWRYRIHWYRGVPQSLDLRCWVFIEPGHTYTLDTYGAVARRASAGRISDRATEEVVGHCRI